VGGNQGQKEKKNLVYFSGGAGKGNDILDRGKIDENGPRKLKNKIRNRILEGC